MLAVLKEAEIASLVSVEQDEVENEKNYTGVILFLSLAVLGLVVMIGVFGCFAKKIFKGDDLEDEMEKEEELS